MVVNRMLPGPSIEICQDDTVIVNVFNNLHLAEGMSMHWHGITQRNQVAMDGVAMITQCPINAYSMFEYR